MLRYLLSLLLIATLTPTALTQDTAVPPLPVVTPATDSDDEAPLPGVGPTGPGGETTLPEVVVQPEIDPNARFDFTAEPADPYDLPGSYPNLSELEFSGSSSVLPSGGSLFSTPQAASIISKTDLTTRQSTNMIQAVEREVGIMMQRTGAGQASPFIRGLTGPQNMILIDGIPVNNSTFRYGPNQYFALIDPGTIQQIEVLRGPQSVFWGSGAIGGAINIVTRSSDPTACDCSMSAAGMIERFATADRSSYTHVGGRTASKNVGTIASGSYLNVNNLRMGNNHGLQPWTDFSQYSGSLKTKALLTANDVMTFSIQHFQQNDVPRSDKYKPGRDLRRFEPQMRDLAYLRFEGSPYNTWFDTYMVTASLQRQEENMIRRRPDRNRLERGYFDVETTGLATIFNKDVAYGRMTYGLNWYHDDIDSTKYYQNLTTGAFQQYVQSQFPDDSYYQQFGVFGSYDADLTCRLRGTFGLRYSNIDTGGTVTGILDPSNPVFSTWKSLRNFHDWSASAGLSYEVCEPLRIVGSIAQGFRAPGLDNLMTVSDNINQDGIDIPNTDLAAEKALNFEIGIKGNYDQVRFQSYFFWNNIDNMIMRMQVGQMLYNGDLVNLYQHENADVWMQGYELDGEYLFTPEWSMYGNLTYIYGQNSTLHTPMSRIPPIQGVLGLRWRSSEMQTWVDGYLWACGLQDRLSPRDIDDSRIPAGGTPGFCTFNVSAGKTFCQRHRVSLLLDNITDVYYRVHGSGVAGPGFSAQFNYELMY